MNKLPDFIINLANEEKNLPSGRATIIKNKERERERERERETFEGDLQSPCLTKSTPSNDQGTSFSSCVNTQETNNSYVRGLTDQCAVQRIMNEASPKQRPAHLIHAHQKSDLIKQINQQEVSYCRISVYRFENIIESPTSETWRINVSLKFYDEQKYFDLLDDNGFCKLVFKCSSRIRDMRRGSEPGYSFTDWSGYQDVMDFANQHPVKLAGKGAFVGKRGKKRTPPPAYHTAMAIVDDKPMGSDFEPFAYIRVGNFVEEIELYKSDSREFAYHGQIAK